MPYQSQSNGYVAFKAQAGLGTFATGSGATILPTSGGQGGTMTKATTASNLVRRDGMRLRGRHGSQKTQGTYQGELMLGAYDPIMEAVMRGTYGSADLSITQATAAMSSATLSVSGSVITASGGSFITAGLRVGDVIRGTVGLHANDINHNLMITALTATAITVHRALTTVAGPVATWTITRPGRVLINPTAPLKRYFGIEEVDADIDSSEFFDDCVFTSMKYTMQPDGILMFEPSWTGTGRFTVLEGSDSPRFTSPSDPSVVPLAVADATVRLGGDVLLDLTNLDLTIGVGGVAPAVAASKYAPDVFTGPVAVSLNLTTLRQDLDRVKQFLAEDQVDIHILAVENEADPASFISIYVPNLSLGSATKSALSVQAGGRTVSIQVPEALVGIDTRGGAFDATMVKIQVSNAT